MKDVGIVKGSYESSRPLIVGKSIVYVHDNIREIEETDEDTGSTYTVWEYHEVQYDKDEYISLMATKLEKQASYIDYISMMSDIELPESEVE